LSILWFQEGVSPYIVLLLNFSYYGFSFITSIRVLVGLIRILLLNNRLFRWERVSEKLEAIWTLVPFFFLCLLAYPSLSLLYKQDEILTPRKTKFAIGHQWYWRYEDPDKNLNYDSYIISGLGINFLRLLDTDRRFILDRGKLTRLLVTSWDVLHSWTIPKLGVKADAVPGRLNSLNLYSDTPRVIFGQCSEICGANHRFIPIAVEAY
jgi:heme/copper-type cytochrome/quinol oxidase subunit 2